MNIGYVFRNLSNGVIAQKIVGDMRKRGYLATCDFKKSRKGNGHFYLRVLTSAIMGATVSQNIYAIMRNEYGVSYVHTQEFRYDGKGACIVPFNFTIQK